MIFSKRVEGKIMQRCSWAGSDPLYIDYHDREWGVPVHDERTLFEMLILDGAQAGLSWVTILKKRENYRAAFDNFNVHKIARYGESTPQNTKTKRSQRSVRLRGSSA